MTSFSERMAKAAKKSRIVLALDPVSRKSNLKYATGNIRAVAEHVCAVKINFHLLLPLSTSQIKEITELAHDKGLQCIADIKLNDIDNTNEIALEQLQKMGFDAVIANPFMGTSTLTALVQAAHKKNMGVIALVYMSHPDASEGYGLETSEDMMYRIFFGRAITARADGIIIGATQSEILKEISKKKKELGVPLDVYSPGVGVQGADAVTAAKNGSDYLIVGRAIIEARDPAKQARQMNEEVMRAFSA
ncbi:orotidine-5'-phosphate decarboxylase [Nitrososphaera sp.]|uniref:orotidine-5'-phosphate decarboxylase n=1 Tax=Nitrososphaera sp. TaxID=1971748 RepID=UPI001801B5D9|nr:orotidine-5'-phosphate decarboxylase [Nitrososphaera sp.]NWG36325.1 orotidine-5'-phosphate decarboxylase [Nitrososphaera sp.]